MIKCVGWITLFSLIANRFLCFSLNEYSALINPNSSPFEPQFDSSKNAQSVPTFNAPRLTGGETTRYGVQQEMCPSGIEPQRSKDGNIIWCRLDEEWSVNNHKHNPLFVLSRDAYTCVPIVGLIHFGNPVKYCCPTKSSYCTKRPPSTLDLSSCTKPAITLYYFDILRRKCRPFTVTGCGDSTTSVDEVNNRFGSLKDCRARCETTACETGETPLYRDNDLEKPFICAHSDQCPHGYTCRLDRLFRRQVCCGKSQFDPCPNYRTFIGGFNGGPKQCDASNRKKDECPHDFVCTKSAQNLFSYCCANIKGVCPSNQKPYIHPLTGATIKCNPHSFDASCPQGFVCQPSVIGAAWGFCCSQAVVTNCPRNTKPFISITTGLPEKCTVGVTTCSHGYKCQNSESNAIIGFCCTPPSSIEMEPWIPPPKTTTAWSPRSVSLETVELPAESAQSEDRSERSLQTTTTPSSVASLEFSTENKSGKQTEKIIRKKILQVINTLTCPEDFEPMVYPGTNLILHCTRGHKHDCPTPSKCLKAVGDVLDRALCCVHEDDKAALKSVETSSSNEVGAFKIVEDNVQLGESSDSACPTIILSRGCRPGDPHICKEDGFFCQFNRQFNEYLCCSLYHTVGNKLLFTHLPELQ